MYSCYHTSEVITCLYLCKVCLLCDITCHYLCTHVITFQWLSHAIIFVIKHSNFTDYAQKPYFKDYYMPLLLCSCYHKPLSLFSSIDTTDLILFSLYTIVTFQRLLHVIIVVLMQSHFRGYHISLSLYPCSHISEAILGCYLHMHVITF